MYLGYFTHLNILFFLGPTVAQIGKTCNYNLDGNTKCGAGNICNRNTRQCQKDANCSFLDGACSMTGGKGCCSGGVDQLFCHTRNTSTVGCFTKAFPGESCKSGIPCEGQDSVCLPSGLCSYEPNDACEKNYNICPLGTSCKEAPLNSGGNEYMCR